MSSIENKTLEIQRTSLLDGVGTAVANMLGVVSIRHRSALMGLGAFDGVETVRQIYSVIRHNYDLAGSTANKDRSKQNWRWPFLRSQHAKHNRSPEVVVERAIAAACETLTRDDWANQIPVASGLVMGAGDGRRAIDLVRCKGEKHFELIELKIGSDTPLYAAVEIIGYCCLWLIARDDRPARPSMLLDAERIDLSVLAPAAYYSRYSLERVERSFDEGVRALGRMHGVAMSFSFHLLDDQISRDSIPEPQKLLNLIATPRRVHPR